MNAIQRPSGEYSGAPSQPSFAPVRLRALVGRCLGRGHDPDTGLKDLDTLRILRRYRGDVESEEALPLGVWGGVEQPGRVRVGDAVVPL